MTKRPSSPGSERARKALDALAPAAGDVVAQRGIPPKALRPLEFHALKILAKKAEDFRDALRPGSAQWVDLTLRIRGTVDVGENQTSKQKQKPNLGEVLAVVLGTLKPKDRTAAVEEAIARLKHPRPEIELSPEWVGFVESLERELTVEEPKVKRGNVTGCLEVEVLMRD